MGAFLRCASVVCFQAHDHAMQPRIRHPTAADAALCVPGRIPVVSRSVGWTSNGRKRAYIVSNGMQKSYSMGYLV
jgi:hypothetical protein